MNDLKCTSGPVLENFLLLWDYLSKCEDPLLPPLYRENEALKNVLARFTDRVLARERGGTFAYGNMILGGIEGTGKTTIARAMVLAVSICSAKYLLLYYEYKPRVTSKYDIPTVEHLVKETFSRLFLRNFSGEFGSMMLQENVKRMDFPTILYHMRKHYDCAVGVVADEVQHLMQLSADTDLQNGRIAALQSFELFARNSNRSFVVLTGSSANLRSRLYSHSRGEAYQDFPDFNRSLCDYFFIPALRDTESLKTYIQIRYPKKEYDESTFRTILYTTGGIGRWIDDYVSMDYPRSPNVSASFEAELRNVNGALRIIVALIVSGNLPVVAMLKQFWAGNGVLSLDQCFGVKLGYVQILLVKLGFNHPEEIIYDLVDKGFLYLHKQCEKSPEEVQLSIPALAKHSETGDVESALLLAITAIMLYTDIQLNAGNAMKAFVYPRLVKLSGAQLKAMSLKTLSIDADGCLCFAGGCKATDSKELSREGLFKWKNEIGLDGVQFDVSETTIIISGWQNKGGSVKAAMSGGALETYRTTYLADREKVDKISDEHLAGVFVKAEVGFLTIAKAVHKTFPTMTVSLGHLVVTTSKTLNASARNLAGQLHTIPTKMTALFGLSPLRYNTRVYDGDAWFRSIMEEELAICLPPALPTTNAAEKASICTVQ